MISAHVSVFLEAQINTCGRPQKSCGQQEKAAIDHGVVLVDHRGATVDPENCGRPIISIEGYDGSISSKNLYISIASHFHVWED